MKRAFSNEALVFLPSEIVNADDAPLGRDSRGSLRVEHHARPSLVSLTRFHCAAYKAPEATVLDLGSK